jgi:hypothetical protein
LKATPHCPCSGSMNAASRLGAYVVYPAISR